MKHFKFWALLIAPMLILSACKKSNNAPPAPVQGISFKVNGTLIKTDISIARIYPTQMEMVIGGSYNRIQTIELDLYNYQPGTYVFGKDKVGMSYSLHNAYLTSIYLYNTVSGTITVTSLTATSISGTFQYDAELQNQPTIHITEGEFNLPVTNAPTE